MNVDHVLVTTDLSEASLRPLEAAADFARSQEAQLSILYVLEEVEAMAHGSAHGLFSPADADKAKQAAEDRLAMLLGQATCLEGLTIHPATIQATSVWRGVNAYVESQDDGRSAELANPADDFVWLIDCNTADHAAADATFQPARHIVASADAAAELYGQPGFPGNVGDQ